MQEPSQTLGSISKLPEPSANVAKEAPKDIHSEDSESEDEDAVADGDLASVKPGLFEECKLVGLSGCETRTSYLNPKSYTDSCCPLRPRNV